MTALRHEADDVRRREAEFLAERLREGHARQKSARRAYALLRSAIRNGDLPTDGRLAEDTLVRDLGTSRNAVRLALQWLGGDGIVTRRPRLGTVVVSDIDQYPVFECSETEGRRPETVRLHLIETADVPATAYLSARLGSGQETFRMSEFLMVLGETPIGIFSRYGRNPAPVLEQHLPDSIVGEERTWYRRIHREAPGSVEATIEAVAADDRTARLLAVDPGHPLLVRETFYRNQRLEPAELHFCFFDGRRAALRANS